jgi:hypothetical protein
MSGARRARVRAYAKINLDLRVIAKRPDGYHELRTVFQTISLADAIDIAFTPARKTSIAMEDALGIPDNLMVRAAGAALEAMKVHGSVEMKLTKRIPMGGGLGGGSSDAAAVLLALPALAGTGGTRPAASRIMQHRAATGQRCAVLSDGRNGGSHREGNGAVSTGGYGAVEGSADHPGRACEHGAGVPRPEPSFDNRIATK